VTTPQIHLEQRPHGPYPYLVHAGSYYWPITTDALDALTRHVSDPPAEFAARLAEIIGMTRYLRHQIDTVLSGMEDRDAELRELQRALATR